GDLAQRGVAAVVGHHDAVQDAGVGAAGADLGEGGLQRLDALLHAALRILLDLVDHAFDSSLRVPSAPPRTMFSRAPGLFMLKTRKGILWSRHRQMAVRSITSSLRSSTPSYVRRSNFSALGSLNGSAVYTPSTLVALSTTSASISMARRQAAESVVKKGLPVPAEKITTSPLLRWRMALRRS